MCFYWGSGAGAGWGQREEMSNISPQHLAVRLTCETTDRPSVSVAVWSIFKIFWSRAGKSFLSWSVWCLCVFKVLWLSHKADLCAFVQFKTYSQSRNVTFAHFPGFENNEMEPLVRIAVWVSHPVRDQLLCWQGRMISLNLLYVSLNNTQMKYEVSHPHTDLSSTNWWKFCDFKMESVNI